MKIKTLVTLNDNVRATFYFYYSRPLTILMSVFGLLAIASLNVGGITLGYDQVSIFVIVFFMVYIFCTPIFLYFNTKKNYKSNKSLQKEIVYEFTDEAIELKSESLSSSFHWGDIYLIRESKSLFYIYTSRYIANILPKRFFSAEEMLEFRNLVKQSGVKSKLKKDIDLR